MEERTTSIGWPVGTYSPAESSRPPADRSTVSPANSSQAFPSRSRRCTTTGTTASMRKKARWFSLITVVIAPKGRFATPRSGEDVRRSPTAGGTYVGRRARNSRQLPGIGSGARALAARASIRKPEDGVASERRRYRAFLTRRGRGARSNGARTGQPDDHRLRRPAHRGERTAISRRCDGGRRPALPWDCASCALTLKRSVRIHKHEPRLRREVCPSDDLGFADRVGPSPRDQN